MWIKAVIIAVAIGLVLGVTFDAGLVTGRHIERQEAVQLVQVFSNYGAKHATRAQGDLNSDGVVDARDLSRAMSALN